ncbi:MAG: radical SAM protein [Syntrophorhabdaceae bacterium]|nr:radical SAM protein [Syntrophorhabdaceae bacterium]
MKEIPVYIETKSQGRLDEILEALEERLNPCILCPRRCRANRYTGETGYCRAPYDVYISSVSPHFGEERPLVGKNGSGTIFFTHCNLRCIFCQNYDISLFGEGDRYSYSMLANAMIKLQERGCHNINLVTPTHYVPQIIKALSIAIDNGLHIPIVYNCGGYESLEVIRLLEGVIDIYMPDIKFLNRELAKRYCKAEDYPDVVKSVLKEMQRQVGDLITDKDGIAKRGLIIRHLVMPSSGENTKEVLSFIKEEISEDAFVNIMAQYHPCLGTDEFPELSRRITAREYTDALYYAESIGLKRASNH